MDQALQIFVGGFAVTLMLSVGLDLPVEEVRRVTRRPGKLGLALLLNYTVLPASLVALVWLAPVSEAVATGLLLCATAPGGPVGAFMTQQARGALGLGVAVVVVSNLANPFLTPAWIGLLGLRPPSGPPLDLFSVGRMLLCFQLLPLAAGVGFRQRWREHAVRIQPWVSRFASLLLILLGIGFVATRSDTLVQVGLLPLGVAVVSVCISLAVGWVAGRGDVDTQLALALTAGIRNMSMVLIVIAAWFPDPETLLGALGYSCTMFVLSGVLAMWGAKRAR